MKPNDKQKKIINVLEDHTNWWQRTNDIDSPTHGGDLYGDLTDLEQDGYISKYDKERIYNKMMEIHLIIRKPNE